MITVAGFNTSIDKLVELDTLRPGQVHRTRTVQPFPGGKGLHVAQTIAALGEPVRLVGLIDAAHRTWFEQVLRERGVEFHGVEVDMVRTCLALREANGRMTEVLEPGPQLDADTRAELLETFRRHAMQSQLVVLSGSLPPGCGDSTYADLVHELTRSGPRCLVDGSGEPIRRVLAARPFLIKPNRDEASELIGASIDGLSAAAHATRMLSEEGVEWPVVSLGAQGVVAADRDRVLHGHVVVPNPVNAVGSGDCLVAGMAVAIARGDRLESALRLGVACGAANAMSSETGWACRGDVEALLPRVNVTVMRSW